MPGRRRADAPDRPATRPPPPGSLPAPLPPRTRNLSPWLAPLKPAILAFQRYRPLDLFPKWTDGKPGRKHLARHRFTREGLQVLDFGGSEINLPDAARTDPRYPD